MKIGYRLEELSTHSTFYFSINNLMLKTDFGRSRKCFRFFNLLNGRDINNIRTLLNFNELRINAFRNSLQFIMLNISMTELGFGKNGSFIPSLFIVHRAAPLLRLDIYELVGIEMSTSSSKIYQLSLNGR